MATANLMNTDLLISIFQRLGILAKDIARLPGEHLALPMDGLAHRYRAICQAWGAVLSDAQRNQFWQDNGLKERLGDWVRLKNQVLDVPPGFPDGMVAHQGRQDDGATYAGMVGDGVVLPATRDVFVAHCQHDLQMMETFIQRYRDTPWPGERGPTRPGKIRRIVKI